MNRKSECSDRYKRNVMSAYVNRAIQNSSSWILLHSEMQHIRQMVVKNGFTNSDTVTNRIITRETLKIVTTVLKVALKYTMRAFSPTHTKKMKRS